MEENELKVLAERKHYAQVWIDRYAPEDYQLTPTEEFPEEAKKLTAEQKTYLYQVHDLLESQEWEAENLQQKLYELAQENLGARKAFQAIYLAFIGKTHGPRAAWMLLAMDRKLFKKRIQQLKQKV